MGKSVRALYTHLKSLMVHKIPHSLVASLIRTLAATPVIG